MTMGKCELKQVRTELYCVAVCAHVPCIKVQAPSALLCLIHFENLACFYTLKVCVWPASNMSIVAIFPTAFAHVGLCVVFW